MREYFMKTMRIGFSNWNAADMDLAAQLWGESDVTRFICSTGIFTEEDIMDRLNTEIHNHDLYQIQYWPIFELLARNIMPLQGCITRHMNWRTIRVIGNRPYETHKTGLVLW
jgi:hypothetical protein